MNTVPETVACILGIFAASIGFSCFLWAMWSNPVVRKFPWYGVFIATPAVMLLLPFGVIVPSEVELVVYEDKAGYHGCGLNMDANEALQLYQRLGLALATIKQAQSKLVILPSKEIIAGANGG